MTKKEIIWRSILHEAIENMKIELTQKELAKKYGFSLSTVFNALKAPRQSGALKVTGRNFIIRDAEKFVYLWATDRNLEKDIIYETRIDLSPKDIEGTMPPSVVFACYSAYEKKYHETPADYDRVYVYADDATINEIKKRFPFKVGYANLIVLKSDPYLQIFGSVTPNVQTFADLWNVKEWYAKPFLESLKNKMF